MRKEYSSLTASHSVPPIIRTSKRLAVARTVFIIKACYIMKWKLQKYTEKFTNCHNSRSWKPLHPHLQLSHIKITELYIYSLGINASNTTLIRFKVLLFHNCSHMSKRNQSQKASNSVPPFISKPKRLAVARMVFIIMACLYEKLRKSLRGPKSKC